MPITLHLVANQGVAPPPESIFERAESHDDPEFSLLEEYAMGHCSTKVGNLVKEHLELCEPCRARFLEAVEWISLMKSALASIQ